jgi:DNA-binding CsgD family transcriptional regulator
VFDNGQYLSLIDDEKFAEVYMNEVHDISSIFKDFYQQGYHQFIWPQDNLDDLLLQARNYGIANGFCITKFSEHYYEAWTFATTPENTGITNTYLHHHDDLIGFSNYFNNTASSILKESDNALAKFKNYNFDYQSIYKTEEISCLNLPFIINGKEVFISSREQECLEKISKGLSIKWIARSLNLSPRTVEYYIDNVKNKLKVATKIQAIEIYYSQKQIKIFK